MTLIIVGGVGILTMIFMFWQGNKLVSSRENIVRNISVEECNDATYISCLSYHGGVPELPKPQKLNLALSDEYLFLFNDKGEKTRVPLLNCKEIIKFTTRKSPDMKGRSIVLWGPFIGIFLKPRFRHFIAVNYKDCNYNNNNILLECGNQDELGKVYDRIHQQWKNN